MSLKAVGPQLRSRIFRLRRLDGYRSNHTRRRGFMVAFIGVDGAGKSSAVNALLGDPHYQEAGIKRVYFGDNEYWIPGARRLNELLNPVSGLRYLPRFLLVLDRQLRLVPALYYRWRGYLVVCDRYYYDDIVARRLLQEETPARSAASAFLDRVKAVFRPRMLRRPDLTLYLDVSPDVAYQRKQDYPFEVMLTTNAMYRKVMSSFPEVVFLDANQSEHDVRQAVFEQLQRFGTPKTGSVVRARARPGRRALKFLGTRLTAFSLAGRDLRLLGELLLRHAHYWHPYIEKRASILPELLQTLRQKYGAGKIALTSTGVLQYATDDWVIAVPLGELSERALSASHENWLTLRQGAYADLVDYGFVKEEEAGNAIYSMERLHEFQCSSTDLRRVLDILRGEMVADQFSSSSFAEARSTLSDVAEILPEDVGALTVSPEAGFRGLVHGDFYRGNLLRNKVGRVVMIDLDRVEPDGVQVFDRIHCVVAGKERERGRHWLSFFSADIHAWSGDDASGLLRGVSRNSLAAYFLWRQSVEIRAMPVPDRAYGRRLRACFYRLLDGEAATV